MEKMGHGAYLWEPWVPKVPEGRLQISVNYGDVFHVPVNASVAYWFG